MEFYTKYSFLDGRFMEYSTISVFAFDLLFIIVLIGWLVHYLFFGGRFKINLSPGFLVSFGFLLIITFVSILGAESKIISTYYLLSTAALLFLIVFVNNYARTKKDIFLVINFFLFSMFFQSIITIVQFIKNKTIGLYFFGEQIISPNIDGVAKTYIDGVKHIRPYGTFSHPNILSIFLLLALVISVFLISKYKKNIYYTVYLYVTSLLLFMGIFLSFSRITWFLTIIFFTAFVFRKIRVKYFLEKIIHQNIFIKILISLFFLITIAFVFYFWPSVWWRINPMSPSTWQSFQDRFFVISKSWQLLKDNWLLGVGAGNFIIAIIPFLVGSPFWMAQPVHNSYLLILLELGVFGLISYLFVLYYIYRDAIRNKSYFLKIIFFIFVFYMFFDHCFWDIRQVEYLLFIFIAIAMSLEINKIEMN